MTYHAPAVNFAGYVLMGVGAAASGMTWVVHKVSPVALVDPQVASQAGVGAVLASLSGIMVIVVNGWVADRKNKRDSDERMALAEARIEAVAAEKVAAALKLADEKSARERSESEARLDAIQAEAAELKGRRVAEREFLNGESVRLRQELDEARDKIARLEGHVETAARGIDTNSAAISRVADAANIDIALPPKMNGGSGAMDDPKFRT